MTGVRQVENSDFESSVNEAGTALAYAYDLAGRRTGVGGSFARANAPQAVSSATYNPNNQLTQWKGASLAYDLNGNLTSDGANTYTWNARNQLVAISGAVSASFQYDPFGRRVSKTIGATTQFLYDGANSVQELSGSSASANLLTGGVDEYFQRTDSAGARNFLTDALGSTLALADSAGALQTQYTFEPFGSTTVTGAPTTNTFVFTGRELDSSGLYFFRARYYNSTLQRFISEDPIGFAGGTNLYGYAGQDPVAITDPSGHQALPIGFPPGLLPPALPPACTPSGSPFGCGTLLNAGAAVPTAGRKDGNNSGDPTRPPKQPCTPLAHDPKAQGIDTLFDAFSRATHPLDMVGLNSITFLSAGGQIAGGGLAIAAGCLEPTPFEPLSCFGGASTGAAVVVAGLGTGAGAVYFFKNFTLPAFEDWGCHE